MLDKRLLTAVEDTYIQELKDLEHIKLRFGEASLYACDVMLRDIKDSNRLNRQCRQEEEVRYAREHRLDEGAMLTLDKLKVNIVSPNFWQQVKEEDLKYVRIPDSLAKGFEGF